MATSTNDRYNLGIRECGSLLVLVRLTVHMEQDQVMYDQGSFLFFQTKQTQSTESHIRSDSSGLELTSTPD